MTFVQRLAAAAGLTEQRLTELLSECGPESGTRLGAAMRHALLGERENASVRSCCWRAPDCSAWIRARRSTRLPRSSVCTATRWWYDDLPSMDNDDLRRGQPTAHKAFDEWTAILAGNALLTLAFEIAARPQTHPDAGVRAELALVLARAAGGRGMVLGQMLDLEAEKRGDPASMSAAHVRRLQALKTGALIAAACEAGAVMAGAADDQRAVLRRYGENLGLAFQTANDLLDAQGNAAAMGKATGKDSAAGKATPAPPGRRGSCRTTRPARPAAPSGCRSRDELVGRDRPTCVAGVAGGAVDLRTAADRIGVLHTRVVLAMTGDDRRAGEQADEVGGARRLTRLRAQGDEIGGEGPVGAQHRLGRHRGGDIGEPSS